MTQFYAPIARLPSGWQPHVAIDVDHAGTITRVRPHADQATADQILQGPILPGLANAHSHAFQRAMAGLAEHRLNPTDSFWSWREQMYRIALQISPDQLYDIALYLYIELLEGGFTSIAEFHYLHHQLSGVPYTNPAQMYAAISQAAADAGIALTLLPTLYSYSDFAQQPASEQQRRFIQQTDQYLRQLADGQAIIEHQPQQRLGGCFHSLRACSIEQIQDVITELPSDWPLHIHISEQQREVQQCQAVHGTTPVRWLNQHIPLDPRWTLIHATHIDSEERSLIAQSGAVAGICPTTEASLGDGIFATQSYLQQGGQLAIGTDSHVGTTATEELRWLEYAQRLSLQQRNCLAGTETTSTGDHLLNRVYEGGARALGQKIGKLAVGFRADWLELDTQNPWFNTADSSHLTDTWIFATQSPLIKNVMVAGAWKIRNFEHPRREQARIQLEKTLHQLRQRQA
ncbi:formimidoylglutamate deiminase [Celerinatantimonas sp. YJH-8]|uniref:formimidoylglutamate deiminase n=1 Tax=Celerinatantimonas sp. YJH-8 TaxID=3228714 RepID=UPI0038BFC22B